MISHTIRTEDLPPPAKYVLELSEEEMLAIATLMLWNEPAHAKNLWTQLPEEVKAAAAAIPRGQAETVIRKGRLEPNLQQRVTRLMRGLSSRPSAPEMDDTEREYGLK